MIDLIDQIQNLQPLPDLCEVDNFFCESPPLTWWVFNLQVPIALCSAHGKALFYYNGMDQDFEEHFKEIDSQIEGG